MFKYSKDIANTFFLHPIALMIMAKMYLYTAENDLPFVVTDTVSTYEDDVRLNRSSPSHRTARAFDISVRGWSSEDIMSFTEFFNRKFNQYGAVPYNETKPELVVYHNTGRGYHFHVQIHRRYENTKVDLSKALAFDQN